MADAAAPAPLQPTPSVAVLPPEKLTLFALMGSSSPYRSRRTAFLSSRGPATGVHAQRPDHAMVIGIIQSALDLLLTKDGNEEEVKREEQEQEEARCQTLKQSHGGPTRLLVVVQQHHQGTPKKNDSDS